MRPWSILIFFAMTLSGTDVFAEQPQQIIEAWQVCQMKSEMDPSCAKVGHQAIKLRDLIESLQDSPQGFGLDIMHLQNALVDTHLTQPQKVKLQDDLDMRLAIVGWLESPK